MIVQKIKFDLMQNKIDDIRIVQGDTCREITFEASDIDGVLSPEDYTYMFQMLKPDHTFIIQTLTNATLKVTEQMGAVTGTSYYCIRITDENDELIYSGQGALIVDDHVISDSDIESVAEVNGYVFPDDFATNEQIEEIVESLGFAKIADNHQNTTETWSSEKIARYAEVMAEGLIADNQITDDLTWSSEKINTELLEKAEIDDNTTSSVDTWSSSKITEEIEASGGGVAYSTVPKIVGTYNDGNNTYDVYEVTIESTQSNPDGGNYVAFPDTVTKIISINGTFSGLLNGFDRYYSPSGMYFKRSNVEYSFGVQININTNPPRIYYVFWSTNTVSVSCDRQILTIQYLK